MTETERYEQRKTAVHLVRSGSSASEVAQELNRSVSWVYKWYQRYQQEGWPGLRSHSRAPHHRPNRIPVSIRQAIREARSELEVEAEEKKGLPYIGAAAIQARLVEKKVALIPGTASIERVLRAAGMTQPGQNKTEQKVKYPHLQPDQPYQLCQVDIVPHFLTGGQAIACFNALDVVSRYPTGQAYEHRRSKEAADFLIQVWQEIGLPHYTQVDNEGCFSGGFTHPGVLGKVVRLALYVGTELVFSPIKHPESNGFVERFHQDYNKPVWHETDLKNRAEVQAQAETFFTLYRHSHHHSALHGASPAEVHFQTSPHQLASDFQLPQDKLPLTKGRVHFMRLVAPDNSVSVLNLSWPVPDANPNQGVWVTLELGTAGATLKVYDQAPDAAERTCLVAYPFPLKEIVHPLRPEFLPQPVPNLFADLMAGAVFRLDQLVNFFSTIF